LSPTSSPASPDPPVAIVERFAPAKVNLFLHVGPAAADGFHPIVSLMAFADVGDRLTLDPAGEGLALTGPFAAGLEAGADNLVLRARDAVLARAGRSADFGLTLEKTLPVASGLGGGSSDAAATLLMVRDHLGLALDEPALLAIAGGLGSDTPACVARRTVVATGRGERLAPTSFLPSFPAVLVNPGVPSPTGPVYRAYDAAVSAEGANAPVWPGSLATPGEGADFLRGCRNDLQAPAVRLQPKIGEALERIAREPEALLVRMSGSGATCFALCADPDAAGALAARLAADQPTWWVQKCFIGEV
jgi:4-diphosphocytidyl-2-C-methyl-D-erythritol kinase